MSVSTNESIVKIDSVIKDVNESIGVLSSELKNANNLVQGGVASIEEISAAIEGLNEMAEKMRALSAKL